MRLRCLESGQRWGARLKLWLVKVIFRLPPLDVAKSSLYRPRFFGRPFLTLMHRIMRGRSRWTVPERELMASFVASRDQCVF